MARDIDADSGRPIIKVNHPAPGDVIKNLAHVAGYGTAFEGTISLRIRGGDGRVIAEGSTQGGSNGVIGQFKSDLAFQRRPNQRLGLWRPSRRAPAPSTGKGAGLIERNRTSPVLFRPGRACTHGRLKAQEATHAPLRPLSSLVLR
jgi:hypothetical protein